MVKMLLIYPEAKKLRTNLVTLTNDKKKFTNQKQVSMHIYEYFEIVIFYEHFAVFYKCRSQTPLDSGFVTSLHIVYFINTCKVYQNK